MTTEQKFSRIHAICTYLRDKPCLLCPAVEQTVYGESVRGCYSLAAEVRNIAVFGNPWGSKASAEHVRTFQETFNHE